MLDAFGPPCLSAIVSMKAYPILLAPLCFTIAAFAAPTDQNEPTYQGRSLSDWSGDLDPHGFVLPGYAVPPAWTAIGHIGTNAIPTLLKWMAEPDPPEPPKPHRAPCFNTTRSQRSGLAFGILGEAARPAIPELTRLARASADPKRAELCAASLAHIGPEAIPSLLSLATNGPPWTRWHAIGALEPFAGDPVVAPVVPMLINCLDDTNRHYCVAGPAARLLTSISPALALPALTNALRSPSARIRLGATQCLGAFKDEAPTVIPTLRAAMSDPDPKVRGAATNSLRRIDAWEARGANPQSRANGRQPLSSEANPTSAAAASRRSP